MDSHCVVCGTYVPEGRTICPLCEKGENMDKWTLQEEAYKRGKADATPKWIPVTERLPEKNTSVLGYYEFGRDVFWYDSNYGFCHIDQYGCVDPIDSVTYWMPLPEAPKGE